MHLIDKQQTDASRIDMESAGANARARMMTGVTASVADDGHNRTGTIVKTRTQQM